MVPLHHVCPILEHALPRFRLRMVDMPRLDRRVTRASSMASPPPFWYIQSPVVACLFIARPSGGKTRLETFAIVMPRVGNLLA